MSWWIAQSLIVTALLACAIELATGVLRIRPAIRHALWLIVLAKLVTPPFIVLHWPWANALPPALESRVLKAPSSVFTARGVRAIPPEPPELGAPRAKQQFSIALAYPALPPEQQSSSSASRANLVSLVSAVWVFGALVFASVQGVRIQRVRGTLQSGLPADPPLTSTLGELTERLAIAAPRLVVATVDSPFVWAINPRRPVVLWPADLGGRMTEPRVRALLLHELVHLKRGDHWTGWLELTAGAIWWWNPLFWYARARLRESAELACDAWVVAELPEGRRDYAEALLDLCGRSDGQPLNAVGISVDGRRFLKRRLTMIMRRSPPVRMPRVALASCALIAICVTPSWARSTRIESAVLHDDLGPESTVAVELPKPPSQALGMQAPSQTTPSQSALPSQDDEARRRARAAISETLQADSESIRALRENTRGQSQQGVVVFQPVIRKAITADEAVRMALDRQLVGREIRLAYLDLVHAQQLVDSTSESLSQIRALVEGIQAEVTAGTAAPIDVVQARAEEARMRQQLVQAQNRVRTSELALKRLTVGDAADPLWNTRLTPADGASFRPVLDDVVAAAHADVPDQSFEDALRAAALALQDAQNTRAFVEASLATQLELFAAGKVTKNFQLFQVQRALNDAKESELQRILEYRKAEVQLNRVQAVGR